MFYQQGSKTGGAFLTRSLIFPKKSTELSTVFQRLSAFSRLNSLFRVPRLGKPRVGIEILGVGTLGKTFADPSPPPHKKIEIKIKDTAHFIVGSKNLNKKY